MRSVRIAVAVLAALWLAAPVAGLAAQQHDHTKHGAGASKAHHVPMGTPLVSQTIFQEGVSVALTLGRPSGGAEGPILEGEDVSVRIALTDSADGTPLTDLLPAGWIDAREAGSTGFDVCREKIQSYLRGTLQIRPAVDLNSSFVLALTSGNTVAVYDPIVGFNISKLYAAAPLPAGTDDWALSPDEDRLFVTMPMANAVAVVNTSIWRTVTTLPMGLRPSRIAFQPDGAYVWVATGGSGPNDSGVSAVDPRELATVAHIPTGEGPHDIAFSSDSRFAFVTNRGAGTLSIIDIAELAEIKKVETGTLPVAAAYSEVGRAIYVAHEGDGSVTVIDTESLEVIERIDTSPGVLTITFDPSGRWGFAVNPGRNEVYILDASSARLTDKVVFGDAPDQVSFTDNFAFVRSTGTPEVAMIQLEELERTGLAKVMQFDAGRLPPLSYGGTGSASAIASAGHHSMDAVYVPNAAERSIYLYHYMMNMPMPAGRVDAYPFQPKAVLVVNRALRETAPGVYTTTFKAPAAGPWDLVFLLDEPRVIHCFDFSINSNPELKTDRRPKIRIEPLVEDDPLVAGERADVRFKLIDQKKGEAQVGLEDVWVWVFSPQNWSKQAVAAHVGDGVYQIELTLPRPGAYNMIVASRTLNFRFEDGFPAVLRAAAKPQKSNDPP